LKMNLIKSSGALSMEAQGVNSENFTAILD
jgi:hypothetical protein